MTSTGSPAPVGLGVTFWFLVLFSILSSGAIVFMIDAHNRETTQSAAIEHARNSAHALTVFRSVYSREVVGRLGEDSAVSVSHDYQTRENAIPLPATLSIELAEALSRNSAGSSYRLVSNHPFPWRADRELTPFEEEALAFLARAPEQEFFRTVTRDDGIALAYASPVTMRESCVACHNQRTDSPRRDWQAGDLRGIQVVTVPLATVSIFDSSGMTRIIAFIAVAMVAAVSLVALLLRRNRREIEETIRARNRAEESEARVRTILENTVDAIVTIDEQGIIESINPAVQKMFGYPSELLLGGNVSMLMPEGDAVSHDSRIKHYLDTGQSRIIGVGREVLGRRADGSLFPIELSISEFLVGDKRMFTGIMRDIAARRRVEHEAREAQKRLAEAIEALPDGFVLYDQDDRLVICNARYREFYKVSAELIKPGTTFEEIIRHGAEHGQYIEAAADVESWIAERMRVHLNPGAGIEQKLDDGRWLRIIERKTESGQIVGFRVDITELKEREEALRRSQELLARTVTAALDAVIIIDHHGKIIEFNPAAEDIFRYRREEVIGTEMAEIIVPLRHRSAHRQGMKSFLETGSGPVIGQRIEIEGLRSDGEEIVIELAIQEAAGNEGPIFIGYVRDITADKAGAKALMVAKERAEEASLAKARFLAMMSHEIRTPLNGVLGVLNLLRGSVEDEDQLKLIKTARQSGKSLLAIINDILDFSKLEAGHMVFDREIYLVEKIIKGVSGLISPLATQKGLTVATRIDDSVPKACIGDQGRIGQVLLNLASNAVKFTETGSIDLSVGCTVTGKDSVTLTFSVADTGIGMEDQKQALIFSEFTTLDPAADGMLGGTGLGLAISKAIVEGMGGEIGCKSSTGVGSTFWFSIPTSIADPSQVAQEEDDEGAGPRLPRQLRVLLAEDNVTNQLVVTQMLEAMGCLVDIAANGLEAVEAARSYRYDVVLMDISMPEMDGMEAAKKIRNMPSPARDMPIVALTAYALPEDRLRFIAAGMDNVVTKPVIRNALFGVLNQIAAAPALPSAPLEHRNPFDQSVLDELLSSQSEEMRAKMLGQFLKDVAVQQAAVIDGRNHGNTSVIERACHVLKSISGTFGATELAAAAQRANDHAVAGRTRQAAAAAELVIAECVRVRQHLEGLIHGTDTAEDTSDQVISDA